MVRVGAIGVAVTALLALGAATASASTSMVPSLRLRAQALERARVLPRGFFSLTTVSMRTAPVDVVRNGVTYSMQLSVFGDPGSGRRQGVPGARLLVLAAVGHQPPLRPKDA